MRARWMTLLATVGVLAAPAGALAGGWAAVELSSTPDGLHPGQPWNVELTVLQHGRTPLEGVTPKIVVEKVGGGDARTVRAEPTGRPGVYRAQVTFPTAGRWEYAVDDGFTQVHSYSPVRIGGAPAGVAAPAAADDEGGGPWPALAAALAAALLAAGLTTALRGRARRARPGAAATKG